MPIARDFSLDAKYRLEEGVVFLSGIQALVRVPLDQHRADKRRGIRTATLISGYRGSPLGGLDVTLERNPELLRDHDVVFVSEIPRTSTGKFLKSALRERFRDHYGAAGPGAHDAARGTGRDPDHPPGPALARDHRRTTLTRPGWA